MSVLHAWRVGAALHAALISTIGLDLLVNSIGPPRELSSKAPIYVRLACFPLVRESFRRLCVFVCLVGVMCESWFINHGWDLGAH